MAEVTQLRKRKTQTQISPQGKLVRTHTRRYRVKNDTLMDTYEVLDLIGIEPGEAHEFDPFATVRSIDVDEEDTIKVSDSTAYSWQVTIIWSTDTAEQKQDDDPLSQRPKVSWDGNDVTKAVYQDRNGVAILNTAKDFFFDPAIEIGVVLPILTIQRNEPSYDPSFAFSFAGKLNSTTWLGAQPGTLRMKAPRADQQFSNGLSYWSVTYSFEFNREGWDPKVLNQGLRRLATIGGVEEKVDILDPRTRNPITSPVPLDAAGQPIPTADLPGAAIYRQPEAIPRVDFNQFGF